MIKFIKSLFKRNTTPQYMQVYNAMNKWDSMTPDEIHYAYDRTCYFNVEKDTVSAAIQYLVKKGLVIRVCRGLYRVNK